MYDVQTIADYVIVHCNNNYWSVSNLKLQKILYFLQAEFLVTKNIKLFEEDIVASDIGPVIPPVYKRFSVFGGAGIFYPVNAKCPKLVDEDKIIIDDMLKELNKYSSVYLIQLTLNQSPWMKNYSKYKQEIITAKDIKEYFSE